MGEVVVGGRGGGGGSDQENAHRKMQLHLHMACTKDSRRKKQWLWQSPSMMHTNYNIPVHAAN